MQITVHSQVNRIYLALAMLWLVAVNLRTGLIGVGPILPRLTDDLDLSKTEAGILVALPTALMGLAAPFGGRLADRFGPRLTISVALLTVAIGGGLRAFAPGYPALVLFTAMFGVGIGIAQPALPRMSRALLPRQVGLATGIYAGGFFTGAVIAALLTAPLLLGDSSDAWRLPLAIWGGLALACLVAWLLSLEFWRLSDGLTLAAGSKRITARPWSPGKSKQAWIVAAIFAGQGLAYYLMVAWLPSVYEELGTSDSKATALYTIFTLMTFPAMVGLPPLSDRMHSRRIPALVSAATFTVGALGLALAIGTPVAEWLWPALAALGLAGLFGMGLLMPVDVAPAGRTGVTAGMVLGVGYAGSALGPVIGGLIRDWTGSFESALLILPILGVGLIAIAWFAPQPGQATRLCRN